MNRRGYNMLELTVGVIIFSLAVIPLFWFMLSSSRTTQNIGKRLMAAQIGQDLLEYLLAKPYDKCLDEARAYSGEIHWVVADAEFRRMTDASQPPDKKDLVRQQFAVSSRHLGYELTVREDPAATNGRMALLEVRMVYRSDDLDPDSPLLSLVIAGLKYDEDT